MSEKKKRLSFFEAAAIVAGYGIGGGIMAVPYLASLSGILPFLGVLIASYLFSLLIHLMVAEMVMRDSGTSQLVELFGKYLFRGKGGVAFTWFFFALILFAFLATLAAYIAGGGEILRDILGLPLRAGQILTYAVAASVVFFGLKAVGLSEKYAVGAIILIVGALVGGSLHLPFRVQAFTGGGMNEILALYGMVMFSFSALFSVPQAVEGLSWNAKKVPAAVAAGMGVTGLVISLITVAAMGFSQEVTKVAIIGWGRAIGPWAFVFGGLFVLLAMLTSYWAISLALADILKQRLKWGERVSWLAATLPTFLIVILGVSDFLGFMRLAGGAIALLVAILVVPVLNGARRHGDVRNPEWSLRFFGTAFFQLLVILAFLVMAVGSMVSVK